MSTYAQAREARRRIVAALAEAGAEPQHVVRTRTYFTDIPRWADVGAHHDVFAEVRPAATMVHVATLIDPRLLVEIEADAALG